MSHLEFNAVRCPVHQQPTNMLCVDYDCDSAGLICSFCEQVHHQEHRKIPAKLFAKVLIDSFRYEETSEGLVVCTLKIDMLFEKMNTLLRNVKVDQQENLLKVFSEFEASQRNDIFSINEVLKEYHHLNNSDLFRSFNQAFRKNFKRLYDPEQDNKDRLVNFVEKAFHHAEQKLAKVKEDIEMAIQKKRASFQYLVGLFPIKGQEFSKLKFYFSDVNKGEGMKLNSPYEACMATSSSQRLMLMQPSLEKNTSVKVWKMKIVKFVSWIGVGMCHLNLIKTANFNFQYTSTGHGNYLISSNGYSWSSFKPEFNSKFESFTFTTGDIIQIEYNPKKKTIHFAKEGTNLTYELEFDFIPGDPLHPAVNLTGVGDCVEIIN